MDSLYIRPIYFNDQSVDRNKCFYTPEVAAEFWRDVIATSGPFDAMKEHVVVICLDHRKKILGFNLVSVGTSSEAICQPRDVLRPVILSGASCFILMHNHPSGMPDPSRADHEATARVKDGARTLGVELTDHVIVGENSHFSFRECGLL